ncbi:TRAP transporter substrate-binding protein [Jannaschia sp. 2305UL9-9]|uniref:TRAP transporter substrate-binding protein n=1 Tax=Jannaschia sp. 2305UL9-9 TaxID=3121638 RepID=UPI00352863C5
MITRRTLTGLLGGTVMAMVAVPAMAQDVTLKLHQFLPAQANVPKLILDVWADSIEEASGDRIKVTRYPSMQLGGSPPQLMDQAIDGVADVIWTVVGYTPGRFPTTEVFELPFMVRDARAASAAYWQMYESHMQEEFADVHVLGTWVHGPGMIHASSAIHTPDDMQGVKIRGATRMVNQLLQTLGATPVGMPVPAIPEALSKGVIDGATIPWEVTGSLKVPELVDFHTEFEGNHLYNLTFVLAMNKDTYEGLPADLRAVIDDNSGLAFSVFAGGTQEASDGPAREAAVDNGNEIITVSEADAQAWVEAAQPVYDSWIAEMSERGIDGQALIDEARRLMDEFEG